MKCGPIYEQDFLQVLYSMIWPKWN